MKFKTSPAPRLHSLFLMVVVFALAPLFLRGESARLEHRGFLIDESLIQKDPSLEAVREAIRAQIDIVFEVGLPTEILQFLQGVPLVLVPSDDLPRGSPGLYQRATKIVKITPRITSTGNKPVLLHELMHAYHLQKIPDGAKNATICSFYEKAQAAGLFTTQSHMMENPSEFFACAATTYLFGETAQEPFTRAKLKKADKEYFAFLACLFGPEAGRFDGKMDQAPRKPKRRR